jgi:O-antigen/teichoic acid export membrane protein
LSVLAAKPSLSLSYSRDEARGLFSFSAQVSLQNLGHYVNNTLPSFAVSRSLGQASLGFYSRAVVLVNLPLTFLAQGVQKTLYPIFPRFRDREDDRKRMITDVASVTTTFVWPLFAALAGLAPLVVELLLGAQWAPVSAIVAPLCLYAAANFSYAIFTSFAESYGSLRVIWLVQTLWTAALVVCLGIAIASDASMRAIALVSALIQVIVHIVQVFLLARIRLVHARSILFVESLAALVAAVWYAATTLTLHSLSGADLAARIGASSGVVAVLALGTWAALPYLPAGRAFSRRGIRTTLRPRMSVLPADYGE